MLYKTTGIVIRTQPIGDNGIIARVYTELLGMQSYVLRGLRRKKSKTHTGLFQIPNIIEIEGFRKEGDRLQSLREANIYEHLNDLRSNMVKSSLAIFIAELVYKSLREVEANCHAFEFLKNAILQLNSSTDSVANFHLAFMLKWTRILGFYPDTNPAGGSVLNLEEGKFTYNSQNKEFNVMPPLTTIWTQLQETELSKCNTIPLNSAIRRKILDHLQDYYMLHLPGFTPLKSPAVLSTILS